MGFLCALLVGNAHAADRVWLIGGGYDLENSQVQIEQNVLWARSVLQALPGERSIQTYFNDGDDPAPDVTLWQKPAEDAASLQLLARVYDADYVNGETVRTHRIAPVEGPATRQTLLQVLPDAIAGLQPGEQGLFVYAGHGSPGDDSLGDAGSQLDLWGKGQLNVRDLRKLVAAQPHNTTLRFVFTQCFAGGFQAAVLPRAGEPRRCGFYAVAQDRLAEGCTASLDVAEYRGYGTYFFAALAGQVRTGGALLADPDRNRDGRVDLYEAHLYTLHAARSTDLPRSSSEQYLLDWEPWYLPLLRVTPRTDNPYAEIATALAGDIDLSAPVRPALHERRKQVQTQFQQLLARQEQTRSRAQTAMEQLQSELEQRWPDVRNPRTLAYTRFLARDLAAAQAFVQGHALYADLVRDQNAYWELDNAMLELQRQLALFDRIEFLEHLGRLRDVFLARAGDAERAVYQGLLDCERQPL
ncbi:MAG: hypothetical protein HY941_10965 [Gammaproteobacteria bacterium]|nr:hypothetical protein [Gammaproteobacteria bacterium]